MIDSYTSCGWNTCLVRGDQPSHNQESSSRRHHQAGYAPSWGLMSYCMITYIAAGPYVPYELVFYKPGMYEQAQGMSYSNGLGLDVASTPHNNLHLEDFRFTDLKWAKSSRMSKRWLVFFVRIKVGSVVPMAFFIPACPGL